MKTLTVELAFCLAVPFLSLSHYTYTSTTPTEPTNTAVRTSSSSREDATRRIGDDNELFDRFEGSLQDQATMDHHGPLSSSSTLPASSASFQASFKEFLSRPENQPILEQHQRKEVRQSIKLQEKIQALKFRSAVLDADLESQKNIAPFLRNRVLKRIVMTFMNDPNGDFEKWAKNPLVIGMLATAQRMMDEGRVSEADMEEQLVRMLKGGGDDPSSSAESASASREFANATRAEARLPTDQLVQALNEHLQERRKGNAAYSAGQYDDAERYYVRAKSIVDLVEGLSTADQEEVVANAVAVNCNLAAVYLARGDFGAALGAAEDALGLDAGCEKALARKAKALVGRGAWEAAEAVVGEMDGRGMVEEAGAVRRLVEARKKEEAKSRETFGKGLSLGTKTPTIT